MCYLQPQDVAIRLHIVISGVSWSSQVTNMAGTYIFVFAVGGTLGSFAMMPAGGALYENDPFSVVRSGNIV